jgi:hypothetical protein
LASQGGDSLALGRALVNLADPLAGTDPAAAAEAARAAAEHLRRAGARDYLAHAIGNLAQALLMLGDWDAARAVEAALAGPGFTQLGPLDVGCVVRRGDPRQLHVKPKLDLLPL